jgi:hypothetical protein
MKRTRAKLVLIATAASTLLGLAVACSFPDVSFSTTGGASEGGADGSTSDVGTDVLVLVDGSDPGAMVGHDASEPIDAAGCPATQCDCDDDHYLNLSKPGCAPEAGVDAGPSDCDDFDQTTHPGQKPLAVKARPPRDGDWNCMNGVEKFYTPNVKCTSLGGGSACDSTFGFEDDPPCGIEGTYVTCKTVTDLALIQKCVVGAKSLSTKQACH